MILQMVLSLAVLAGAPRIGQMSPDVRSGSGVWLTGDGFKGARFLYENAVTIAGEPTADHIKQALANVTAVDWSKGTTAPSNNFDDTVSLAFPNLEQIGAYCTAIAAKNADGLSSTYFINKPRAFGLAGNDPARLFYGPQYAIVGRHLAATKAEPSLWLVGSDKAIRLPISDLGGRGTGGTRDLKRSRLWFSIPDTVPAGTYLLFAFHGENSYGLSNPMLVDVVGTRDPWDTAPIVDVEVNSGADITTPLLAAIMTAKPLPSAPLILRLPPGVFTVSMVVDVPSNVAIIGSGINATRLVANSNRGDYSAVQQRIPPGDRGRSSMIRIVGSNVKFADLSLELPPNSVQSIIGAGNGINSVQFHRVRFENLSPFANDQEYSQGTFYRSGRWQYWRFEHCEWRCQFGFEANMGPLNGWASNGAADNCLILGGSFESVYGRHSASLIGAIVGRSCLVQGLDISRTRRGFSFAGPDGCLESVICACSFDNMLSEIANGETIVHESRGGCVVDVAKADKSSFTVDGDTDDRTRWTVAVIDGTGKFQYRVIASSVKGLHRLETPWEIVPDSSSKVLICQCPTDCAYVWNRFTSCVGGINFFGNAFGNVTSSNWMRGSREGILLNTNWNSSTTTGFGGQRRDGHSVSWFGSHSFNLFEDSSGFHLVAPRTTEDSAKYKHPQIAFQLMQLDRYLGDVSNQLWAAEGTEQVVASPAKYNVPLIDYIAMSYETSLSGRPYLHKVLDRVPLPRNVWYRTSSGIGNIILRNHTIDNTMISNSASLMTTNPENN